MCIDPHQTYFYFYFTLRGRLAPLNMYKLSSGFYCPFQGGASFVDPFYVSRLSL